jgi:hypothetical protein
MRTVEAGLSSSFEAGRIGRSTRLPPQLGQVLPSLSSAHARQNVHSNEQIIAFVADGGKGRSQHSQLGRNSSIRHLIGLAVGPVPQSVTVNLSWAHGQSRPTPRILDFC